MGVHEGRGQLAEAVKQLHKQWLQTRATWKDEVSNEFEKTYLVPLEQDGRSALSAMDHMASLLSRVRQDCE